ncbi:MAG: TraR/DksA C4-type zinc finger protein [Bacteroidetes bacterium]|nr:TraR/DksA C4-type zinc finger protein [Bacteroidota bacterium]MBS1933368.1 TraR/DksA C4-type zinc finger protein [Bacteroidota bacterium]
MATKKKAAKPAKHASHSKKTAPAKKAAKPSHSAKAAKPAAKKAAKPVAKKPVAKKTPVAPAKPAPKKVVTKAVPVKTEVKKPVAKVVEKKEIVKPLPFKQPVKKEVLPSKPTKVVIPDIKTKTVRKYEPEFTKSVLDTLQQEQSGPVMRYSDADLAEFRELINKKLDAAKKELAYLQGLITRKDEMGGDNDDARYMTMEDGSMSMEREQLSQMASRQITFIDHLEKALMRIENKTYGICRVTGKLIDKARLRAVPHATLSIEAKQMMNK